MRRLGVIIKHGDMNNLLKYYFLNYYDFFHKNNKDEKFAIARALNLIFTNISFLIFTVLVFLMKYFPQLRDKFPIMKQYGIGYFLLLILIFYLHYLMSKNLRKLIMNTQNNFVINKRNKTITLMTTPCIIAIFLIIFFM